MNKQITCNYCGGTGKLDIIEDTSELKYGKHTIGKDWAKHDNVFIWFSQLKRGIPGYVYEKSSGDYVAPFRGELVNVIKDTRDEFREAPKGTAGDTR